jgi:WhiB family redox-sensing transcriptional regulator
MSWREEAACRGMDTELWFTTYTYDGSKGKTICRGCPVQFNCALYAVNNGLWHGIFGGMTPEDRRTFARKFGVPRHGDLDGYVEDGCRCGRCIAALEEARQVRGSNAKCGSSGGYREHYRLGEEPCVECRDVHNARERVRARERRRLRREAVA